MNISFRKSAILLILISTLVRLFWANQLEFGNDEVYYWLYAKYPDLSHFDHPPFVGFFIQFFTFDLFFDSELAIRLAAIVPASINMYVLFLIGKRIKNEKTGFISVLLYNLSIYGLVISGTFILPDAPMLFFWLLSFYFLLQVLPYQPSKENRLKLWVAFFFIACAIYSKYQAVFLLFGVVIYVLLFNKKWLKEWGFYLSFLLPLIAVFLIFYWNYKNDFISYKFHNNRVSLFSLSFNKDSFLREVLGQMLYNNPYIFISLIVMLIAFFKKRLIIDVRLVYFFLTFSVPLIFTTVYLSLFKDTLPHWSGVSYMILLPVLAFYLSNKINIIKKLTIGLLSLVLFISFFSFEINKGWILPVKNASNKEKQGRKDVFNDMYGWKQAGDKIKEIVKTNNLNKLPIISNKWYPAAHIDYYIAKPNKMNVYGVGELSKIHKYYWINKKHPIFKRNKVLYITDSRNFKDPKLLYMKDYATFKLLETIPIKRNHKIVKYVFLYILTMD